jgi:hypothetical protein
VSEGVVFNTWPACLDGMALSLCFALLRWFARTPRALYRVGMKGVAWMEGALHAEGDNVDRIVASWPS